MIVVQAVFAMALSLTLTESIVVYERSGLADPYPNLKLKKSSILKATNFTLGISICARWNFKHLDTEAAVFQNPVQGLGFGVIGDREQYRVQFGNLSRKYVFEVDEDHMPESFIINQWHHVCLSFNRKTNHLVVIQVLNFSLIFPPLDKYLHYLTIS